MTSEELNQYLDKLRGRLPLELYVSRRFAVAKDGGDASVDLHYYRSSIFRDREPDLAEILDRRQVMILAEPGGGKSIAARAAVHELAARKQKIPIYAELKEYRGSLADLLSANTPASLLGRNNSVEGVVVRQTYVLDGVDEIPNELLGRFSADLLRLTRDDPETGVFLTARQAFYVTNRSVLPPIASIFHILDFSDDDILTYLTRIGLEAESFLQAVNMVDAREEIRNPFILSVVAERFRQVGDLSDRKTENLSYMIERLIQSRPRFNQHRQRRALRLVAVAMETYARNELTEDEALLVIKEGIQIADADAPNLLNELYASILKKTGNGLAFQMRSYGEYLAAEMLEDAQIERVRELAFLDYNTPNESWRNAIGYLAELNSAVRGLFVRQYPIWMLLASPSVFSEQELDVIATEILKELANRKQFVADHPRINVRRLSRFITPATESLLSKDLESADDVIRGNALVLLGLLRRQKVLPVAMILVTNRTLGVSARYCGIVALVNAGNSSLVPELIAALDKTDPLHINLLDVVGTLMDESQLPTVLPLILAENAMLSSAYYHFRELKSRSALVQTLRYFVERPNELNSIRAEGYIEPILKLLPKYFDVEIAELCADLLSTIERQGIYPDDSGPLPALFELIRDTDKEGIVARRYFQARAVGEHRALYHITHILAGFITVPAGQWLIETDATAVIREVAPYVRGEVRELLRPHSEGIIDAQDAGAKAYVEEQANKDDANKRKIAELQHRLIGRVSLNDALADFWELKEEHWPELPEQYEEWLESEISKQMVALDLEKTIEWKQNTLWEPRLLPFLIKLIGRYKIRLDPDVPIVLALLAWDNGSIEKYYQTFGLSKDAHETLERLLEIPPSSRSLDGLVRFLDVSQSWSARIEKQLVRITVDRSDRGYTQVTALNILERNGVSDQFVERIASDATRQDLRDRAFEVLIERQHRATIERALAQLLADDLTFKSGEVGIPFRSELGWITKIRAAFAWEKLSSLRAKALKMELPLLTGLITDALAKINRPELAKLISRQISIAPIGWRHVQQSQAIEQEHAARLEAAQATEFDVVLKKVKGATSVNRLLLVCEGSTDIPVYRSLIEQIKDTPEIRFDFVGGWSALRAKDPNLFLLGCKAAIVVMDGDEGRHMSKANCPLTKMATKQVERLAESGVTLVVLKRYGIENYFPQSAMQTVTGLDLSMYFPLPHDISVLDHVSRDRKGYKYKVKRWIAKKWGLKSPAAKYPLYSKSRNRDLAKHIDLARDLPGTDLFEMVNEIADEARKLEAA